MSDETRRTTDSPPPDVPDWRLVSPSEGIPCLYCVAENAPDGTEVANTPHDECLRAYDEYADSVARGDL